MNDALNDLISTLYEIDPVSSISNVKIGSLSRNFIVESKSGKYFLKDCGFDASRISEIHGVINFLYSQNIPVICPLFNRKNQDSFRFGDTYYALYPYVEGTLLSLDTRNDKNIEEAGETLAAIHGLSAGVPPFSMQEKPYYCDKRKFLERANKILSIINSKSQKDSFDLQALEKITLQKRLVEDDKAYRRSILKNDHIIHGDYTLYNMFFDNKDRVAYIFDLEKTSLAPRAMELARSIDRICFHSHFDANSFRYAEIYLHAYNRHYPISKSELSEALSLYYREQTYKLWLEKEHYLGNNFRADDLLENDLNSLKYFQKHFESFSETILSFL